MLNKVAFAHAFAIASVAVQLAIVAFNMFAPLLYGQELITEVNVLEIVLRNLVFTLITGWITGYLIALVYNKFTKT